LAAHLVADVLHDDVILIIRFYLFKVLENLLLAHLLIWLLSGILGDLLDLHLVFLRDQLLPYILHSAGYNGLLLLFHHLQLCKLGFKIRG
jgi:hypothetical protein